MHGQGLLEGIAAIVLVSSGLVLVRAAWLAHRRATVGHHSTRKPSWDRPVDYAVRVRGTTAAALSLGAAVIHFAVVPEHLDEYLPFGIAFIALGIAQLGMAIALLADGTRFRIPAIVLTLSVLSAWTLSRTAGLPVGPHAWVPEEIGMIDATAAILESALVLVLLVPVARLATGVRWMRVADAMSVAVVPVIGSVGLVTLIAIASIAPASHP